MANTQVLIQEQGRGYIGHALDYDAAGKGFMAVANADPANANITPVKIYRAERGQPFGTTPIGVMIPNLKVDTGCVAITHTGNNLVVSVSTHAPGEAPRATMVETFVVANVWTTTPGFEAEKGGAGGFTGDEGGSSVEVDYNRIQTMINTKGDEVKHWVKDQLAYVLRTETVPAVRDGVVGQLSGDPGPIADLLYKRIADGTWEQLNKFGEEVGYKPPKGAAPKKEEKPAVGSGPKE